MKNLLRLRVKALVLTAIFLIGIASMLSAQKIAIIDAGSSGSRLYVYELDVANKQLNCKYSILGDLLSDDTNVATFITNMTNSYPENEAEKIQLYVLATAGRRGKNNSIYQTIERAAVQLSNFELKSVMTISGRYEGFCAWVAANVKHGKIDIDASRRLILKGADNPTYGILEIGGASMQIAFKADGNSADYISRDGLGSIYSKSYLGCGVNSVFDKYKNNDIPYNFNANLNTVKQLIPTNLLFWGLGGSIKAIFESGINIDEYSSNNVRNQDSDGRHPHMNAEYIKYVTSSLALPLNDKLKAPANPSSWTEGAALDILLYGPPEAYNNN